MADQPPSDVPVTGNRERQLSRFRTVVHASYVILLVLFLLSLSSAMEGIGGFLVILAVPAFILAIVGADLFTVALAQYLCSVRSQSLPMWLVCLLSLLAGPGLALAIVWFWSTR